MARGSERSDLAPVSSVFIQPRCRMRSGDCDTFSDTVLFLASVIHSWYAGHASLPYGHAGSLYRDHRSFVLAVSVLLLVTALILLWWAEGFWFAAGGAVAYFLVLPLITYPLLSAMGLVPTRR